MVTLYRVAGWLVLALVAFVTLAPLNARPEVASAHIEHFAAFFLLGLLFARAYPNRTMMVVVLVVGGAVGLEVLQLLTPDRHARLIDALVKAVGGLWGIGAIAFMDAIVEAAKARSTTRAR